MDIGEKNLKFFISERVVVKPGVRTHDWVHLRSNSTVAKESIRDCPACIPTIEPNLFSQCDPAQVKRQHSKFTFLFFQGPGNFFQQLFQIQYIYRCIDSAKWLLESIRQNGSWSRFGKMALGAIKKPVCVWQHRKTRVSES